jgi:hypothetical protein
MNWKDSVFVFITEIFWQTFWRNNWWSIFDIVKRLCSSILNQQYILSIGIQRPRVKLCYKELHKCGHTNLNVLFCISLCNNAIKIFSFHRIPGWNYNSFSIGWFHIWYSRLAMGILHPSKSAQISMLLPFTMWLLKVSLFQNDSLVSWILPKIERKNST